MVALVGLPMFAQDSVTRVYAERNRVHIVYASGRDVVVAGQPGQAGVDSIQTAAGRTAGWLALYDNPDGGSPVAETLVLWRAGKVIQRFQSEQTFWSWSFYAGDEQVAYHVGPTHGESSSHCELHEVSSGRKLASWDGDLDDPKRPPWTRSLDH